MTNKEEVERLSLILHKYHMHPDYEYVVTKTARKSGISVEPEGEGWEPNCYIDMGEDPEGNPYPMRNWERFEYHEEEYWRRLKRESND